jgi:drug/metabolite transporter (DMT)-like permease
MVTYIIPIVSVIIGFFDGESLGVIHIIGLSLILFGVYISSLGRKKIKT